MRLRPHHLVDIIVQHGEGEPFRPHPYGHALHSAAAAVIGDHETRIQLVVGADDICAPCAHLVNGRCDDVLGQLDPSPSKQAYNDGVDRRLLAHLGIAEGAAMTFREYLHAVRGRLTGMETVVTHPGEDPALKLSRLSEGLRKLGV
jgi:hypothetical protein